MRLKRHLITEKTFRVNEDIKFIYDTAFKKFVKDFANGTVPSNVQKWIIDLKEIIHTSFDSSELQTKDAKAAHLVNPITIEAGIFNGSFYNPGKKLMRVGFPIDAAHIILTNQEVPENQRKYLLNEMKETKIKATIGHELSHWINDSMFGFQISKLVKIADELKSGDVLKLHKRDVNMTHFEIDAMIHGIKAVKSKIGNKEWDTLTFEQVGELYTSLWSVIKKLGYYGKDIAAIYKKMVLKRMDREKLLGKNMRKGI